jgi:LemA protein
MIYTSRSGAIGAGMIALLVLALLFLAGGGCAVSRYNTMVSGQEKVDGALSGIGNQYKRRSDLIPQLVETVKGSASYEKGVLTEVTAARASVGKAPLPAAGSGDSAAAGEYLKAQQHLGASLSRLLVTVERYPDLKAGKGFLDLQTQIEGTENRIAVARTDYINAVKNYNTSLRKFPGNLIASSFGFERMPQLEAATAEEREVPKIDFGGGE